MLGKLITALDKFLFSNLKTINNNCVRWLFKLTWIIAVGFSLSGLLFYSKQAYNKWHNTPDISISIKSIPSRDIPFPAITICQPLVPTQILNGASIYYYFQDRNTEKIKSNLSSEFYNYLPIAVQTCLLQFASIALLKIGTNRTETNFMKLLKNAKYNFIFRHCEFRNLTLSCDNLLTQTLTDFGFCYTFNMQKYFEIFQAEILSDDFDFYKNEIRNESNNTNIQFVSRIRAEKKNSFGVLFEFRGKVQYCRHIGHNLKLIIHKPNEIPTIFHDSYFVEILRYKYFFINAKVNVINKNLHDYSTEIRQCYFEGEKKLKFFKNYSKALCEFECLTNYTLRICGCTKFNMPRENNTKVCDLDKVQCYQNIKELWPNINESSSDVSEDCKCLKPCTDIEYNFEVEKETIKSTNRIFSYDGTYFHTSFKNHVIDEHTKYVVYTIQNFIADCGGLIGLFLGFSLLSIYEIVCDFFVFSIKSISNRNFEKSIKSKNLFEKKILKNIQVI
ncbi:hypothetical protein PVAND_005807 [Polypedilum vanderplanki]|uniref:Uncharacterized protein n=1 Tax=Polypedilum vanderplanki TaxID=319348 RepID=A0A9J6C355_POLVA|nr:hypothetical protein PVAND_005807 [Polypedilum vanderplanki]